MEEKRGLVERQAALPAMTVGDAVKRHNEMVAFVKTIMREGIDYGVIPGTGGKPTLYKPGAEKLCTFFGFTFEPELIERVEDWEKPFFYFRYRAVLQDKTGHVVAVGEASINSMESKYRWRNIPVWKATEEEKAIGTPTKRKGKDGKPYLIYQVPNDDIYSQVNTLQKMAQKRALTQVVLLGCNASEFFTQDLEDIVEGEFTEAAEAKPVEPAPSSEPPPSSDEFDHAGARERVAEKRAARVEAVEPKSEPTFEERAQAAFAQGGVQVLTFVDIEQRQYDKWKRTARAGMPNGMPLAEFDRIIAVLETQPISLARLADCTSTVKGWKPPEQGAIKF